MTPVNNLDDLLAILEHPTEEGKKKVADAYAFAQEAHKNHERMSGEPYFNHLYATAYSLAELGMDTESVAAGLLHDSIEDVGVTEEEIRDRFGPEVLFLVQGVTKLGTLKYRGAQRHVESLRRLFIATSQDIRVLIIKLMDRLHNMNTLEHVPKEKQHRIASETLEIYAPIADRLGMGSVKRELEDLAFRYVYPEQYAATQKILKESELAKTDRLEQVMKILKRELVEHEVRSFRTSYRVKGLYSLYRKLQRKEMDIGKIYDILALRIIVPTVEDCYRVLGVVHSLWHPLPGKIKDYIAFPKPNGYRSLHTTVVTKQSGVVEIQIRSEEIHRSAEFGIASHLSYKESKGATDRAQAKINLIWIRQLIPSLLRLTKKPQEPQAEKVPIENEPNVPLWIRDLAEAHRDKNESSDFINQLKNDFFTYRVFVFTPKGDVIDLPVNSSPVDFAYAVHSDIGNHMSGAKVNGKLAALDSKLKNGDIVEIETRKSSHPSAKWLEYAKTSMARKHIHGALQKLRT